MGLRLVFQPFLSLSLVPCSRMVGTSPPFYHAFRYDHQNQFFPHGTTTMSFLFIYVATAIKCWSCATDQYNGQFCNDPFDLSIANEHQQKWAYIECKHPPGQSNPYDQPLAERAVCKKVKQISKLTIEQNHDAHLIFIFSHSIFFRSYFSQCE